MHSNTEYCSIHGSKAMEDKDSVPHSVVEKDTEALLLHDVLLNGILAIGTLGHHVDSDSLSPPFALKKMISLILIMDDEKAIVEERDDEEPRNDQVKEMLHWKQSQEILIREVEDGGGANIQERPLLMLEKVEKVRTTLADLFAAEVFSSSSPREYSCQDIIDVGASTSKHASCMEKMHQKKPRKPTPKPLKATRKLSRVWLAFFAHILCPLQIPYFRYDNNLSTPIGTL
ncbi:hypothetical protein Zm00014a_012961 [Zea mays]|uniref:Protein TILLER ANGLE CONTROL 1 n=1 Tax=Zea mays TaxID=4577 RepID=A0A3L6E2G2_MAIZE|nr:hypothetical protein Zm00014a_012961 [Zea mays]